MKDLNRRAWKGLAQFLLALACLLFVPAWNLHYWQAWWYLAVFGGCVLAITIDLMRNDPALLERRLSAGPAAEKEKSQKLIQALAAAAFVSLYVLSALDYRFHWSFVAPFAVEVGDLMVALGFLIIGIVFKENSYTSATVEVGEEQEIVTSGPYSVVRHPMYAGALIMLLGTPPALASWWGELMVVVIAGVIVWRLIEEEKFLAKNLRGYEEYTKEVRSRLIPGIF